MHFMAFTCTISGSRNLLKRKTCCCFSNEHGSCLDKLIVEIHAHDSVLATHKDFIILVHFFFIFHSLHSVKMYDFSVKQAFLCNIYTFSKINKVCKFICNCFKLAIHRFRILLYRFTCRKIV